jgi:hypothetical protein
MRIAMTKPKTAIGRAERISFPRLGYESIPAKIDTGAMTSALWASQINVDSAGNLSFYLFDEASPYFRKERVSTKVFSETMVTSSMGMTQRRYVVKLVVRLQGRRIKASFTLADRAKQVYPILIGRNVLRGKFIVDVKNGNPDRKKEKEHKKAVQKRLKTKGQE